MYSLSEFENLLTADEKREKRNAGSLIDYRVGKSIALPANLNFSI